VQRARLQQRIDIGMGDDRFIRQRRRFDAATNPQKLAAIPFDLLTADGDGGDNGGAVFIHRGPRLQQGRAEGRTKYPRPGRQESCEQAIGWTIPEIVFCAQRVP
jgi:hypothetical protein